MIGDYIFALDVRVAIGRVVRLLALVSVAIWLTIAVAEGIRVLGGPAVDLTTTQRSVGIAIAAVPALCYVFALYIGMGSFGSHVAGPRARAVVIFGLGLLLVAPIHIALRYQFNFIAQAAVGIELTSLVGLGIAVVRLGDEQMASVLNLLTVPVRAVRLLMWDLWRWADYSESTHERLTTSLGGINPSSQALSRVRRPSYTDERTLRAFQATHTCSVVDSRATAASIKRHLGSARTLRILDIGGGDGTFTKHFVAELATAGHRVSHIDLVEPGVGLHDDYAEAVREVVPNLSLRPIGLPFEAASSLSAEYDVVLAAHSMYAILDGAQTQADTITFLDRLCDLTRDGILAVVLASSAGSSYRFKSDALRLVTGDQLADTTAESFLANVHSVPAFLARPHDRTWVDNLLDLTDVIPAAPEELGKFRRWISYFIRVPERDLNDRMCLSLVALARIHSVPFAAVALDQAASARQDATKCFSDNSVVLPHRTVIDVWKA